MRISLHFLSITLLLLRADVICAQVSDPSASHALNKAILDGPPYRAVAIQVRRVDWIDRYIRCIDDIANLGADTVSIAVETHMENSSASKLWLDLRFTPTSDQLGRLIDHARAKGLRVMLVPSVAVAERAGGAWCGTIRPASWEQWWASYRDLIHHFAWIARDHHVEILCVGASLISTESHAAEWRETIAVARKEFPGKLIYSASWDHYEQVPFWSDLDMIGMNAYWRLGSNRFVSGEQLQNCWKEIQDNLVSLARKIGKPVLFTEVGYCSLPSAVYAPWDPTITQNVADLETQERLYQAFLQAWHGNPMLAGFVISKWTPDEGGLQDQGYTPQGKPAEAVLRSWLTEPRWSVRSRPPTTGLPAQGAR